jgi:hypothetical protein
MTRLWLSMAVGTCLKIPVPIFHPYSRIRAVRKEMASSIRQRGCSPRGKRLVMDAPFGSWGTQTFVAGLSADAMIAPWIIEGARDGPAAWVVQEDQPGPSM